MLIITESLSLIYFTSVAVTEQMSFSGDTNFSAADVLHTVNMLVCLLVSVTNKISALFYWHVTHVSVTKNSNLTDVLFTDIYHNSCVSFVHSKNET